MQAWSLFQGKNRADGFIVNSKAKNLNSKARTKESKKF